jgi:cytochrome d ubiquinol oxidase subunit I
MKVEDAATGNTGVWITFIGVVIFYIALAAALVYVLRRMSQRFREGTELVVPYGPSDAGPAEPGRLEEETVDAP